MIVCDYYFCKDSIFQESTGFFRLLWFGFVLFGDRNLWFFTYFCSMKLRQIILLILLFSSIVVKSQVMWMVIFGDKLSNDKIQSGANISVSLANFAGLSDAQYQPSWALGGYTEITIDSHWKLQPEFVFKSPSGASNLESYYQISGLPDSLVSESRVYADIINFSIPIYLKYKTKYVGFGIGPQFSLAYRAKLIEKGKTVYGNDLELKDNLKSATNYKNDI